MENELPDIPGMSSYEWKIYSILKSPFIYMNCPTGNRTITCSDGLKFTHLFWRFYWRTKTKPTYSGFITSVEEYYSKDKPWKK